MDRITFKQVYDGMSQKIKQAYPQKKIYGSSIHQNLEEGMFNIIPISATDIKQLGKRVQRKATFDCLYYAEDYEELLDIADQLPLLLAQIKTVNGHIVHGILNTPSTEIADGVLHCVVTYSYFGFIEEVLPEGGDPTDLMYYLEYSPESEVK